MSFNYHNIEGLGQHGCTRQTMAIAETLRRNKGARTILIAKLLSYDADIVYSNQDFDQQAELADVLADMARSAPQPGFGTWHVNQADCHCNSCND